MLPEGWKLEEEVLPEDWNSTHRLEAWTARERNVREAEPLKNNCIAQEHRMS